MSYRQVHRDHGINNAFFCNFVDRWMDTVDPKMHAIRPRILSLSLIHFCIGVIIANTDVCWFCKADNVLRTTNCCFTITLTMF